MGRVRIEALLTAWTLLSAFTWAADSPNEVPFKLYRGYAIVVSGSLGGLTKLNFLVDTGAVPSVVDSRITQKLHLHGKPGLVDVPTETLTTERVIVPDVELGPSHVGELSVIVQDLSFAEKALGTRVDAMIGFDVLGQSAFTIDYKSRKLVFGPVVPSFNSVPYYPGLSYAIVVLQIQQQKLEILVDTGTSDLVLFQSGVRDCHSAIKIVGQDTWASMGGKMPVKKAQLLNAYLGAVPWGKRVVYIPDGSTNQPSGLQGLLGTVALGKRVAFDPVRGVMAW